MGDKRSMKLNKDLAISRPSLVATFLLRQNNNNNTNYISRVSWYTIEKY